ncbi:MAG: hypothetical protein K5643_00175 [Saccharofermentans sp.]|nr:hypothetical protein [Saccharofermentans sp.]
MNITKIVAAMTACCMLLTGLSACRIVTEDSGKTEAPAPETSISETSITSATETSASSSSAASDESKESEITISATERPESSATSSAPGYEKIYGEILEAVHEILTKGPGDDIPEGMTGILELYSYVGAEALNQVGYKITDLTGDSVPELIIGSGPEIYALFTVKNGEAFLVTEGWGRSSVCMLSDGRFYTSGSGGAATHIFGRYSLSEDATEIIWDDYYFTDIKDEQTWEIGHYHNKTGDMDKTSSEELAISDEDFAAIETGMQSKVIEMNYQPISFAVAD